MDVVTLFQRRGAEWQAEIAPTRGAGYPVVAYSDSLGLLLAVVRADPRWENPDSSRGGYDQNSLFLYARQPTWRILRRVAHGVTAPVDHPSFVRSGTNLVLSWAVETANGSEARAILDVDDGPPDLIVVLDPAFGGHPPVRSLAMPGGHHLWITRHIPDSASSSQLRFVGTAGQGVSLIGHLPSPFFGGFGASSGGGSDVLLAGLDPEYIDHRGGRVSFVHSLLVRVRITCSPGVTRR
jgi:hypothetical protein